MSRGIRTLYVQKSPHILYVQKSLRAHPSHRSLTSLWSYEPDLYGLPATLREGSRLPRWAPGGIPRWRGVPRRCNRLVVRLVRCGVMVLSSIASHRRAPKVLKGAPAGRSGKGVKKTAPGYCAATISATALRVLFT